MIFGQNALCNYEVLTNIILPYFKQSQYVHVNINGTSRPILYLFHVDPTTCNNNMSNIIKHIRSSVMNMGLNNPYIVLLDERNINAAIQDMNELELDAISLYAFSGTQPAAPFTSLHESMSMLWNQCKQNGSCQIVTPIPLGWDPRPRNSSFFKNTGANETVICETGI